ncbi:MAG: glycosyltransferase [Verrucomicrobia bacterium]|nr:glycosyltransferase [Verrucomicrobiota bacterium]
MDLSIIIVNYNVQFFLENCLNSVYRSKGVDSLEVIVVDNNSVDDSCKMIRKHFPEVKLIENKANVGFSKANNQAIKVAHGEFILLLNPDTVVEESTFEECLKFFRKTADAGGVGVRMIDGKGVFLPESKRGLPTPPVAFYKIFGLSALFPKSKTYGKYHLGYLNQNETHQIDILSGAFMMIRKSVLDEIGDLDEHFFMYGEDIDLSYRIAKAGYRNYYLANTSIIHYKGESTKKSSINYVVVFYKAMVIFARKHFSQKNARLFSILINFAIYIRAFLAILSRTINSFVLPIVDAFVMLSGFYLFKDYYEQEVKFPGGGGYPVEVETYGIPIVAGIYLFALWINGGYLIPTRFRNIVKGLFVGVLLVLIGYSLLDEDYRFSRAIVLFTSIWAFLGIMTSRLLLHLLSLRPFRKNDKQRIVLVGKSDELDRISGFFEKTIIEAEIVLKIDANDKVELRPYEYDGKLYQLKDIIEIYNINEVVFCSKDLNSSEIIQQMAILAQKELDFKIAPPKSMYIIGSNSIDHSGEYYLLNTNLIHKKNNERNKRLLDIISSTILLILSPLLIWFNPSIIAYYKNLTQVIIGNRSMVAITGNKNILQASPKLRKGILAPIDLVKLEHLKTSTEEQLNFEYVRNYTLWKDIEIIVNNLHLIGKTPR